MHLDLNEAIIRPYESPDGDYTDVGVVLAAPHPDTGGIITGDWHVCTFEGEESFEFSVSQRLGGCPDMHVHDRNDPEYKAMDNLLREWRRTSGL